MGRIEIVPQYPNDPLALALAEALGDRAQVQPSALAEALTVRQTVLSPAAQPLHQGGMPTTYALPGAFASHPALSAPALQTLMLDRLGNQSARPAEMAPLPPERPSPPPMEPRQQTRRFEVQTPGGKIYEVEAPDEQAAYQAVRQMEAGQGAAAGTPAPDWSAMGAQLDAAPQGSGIAPTGEGPWTKYQRATETGLAAAPQDYNRIMTALRNADAAGDTAAATRLAQMAREAKAGQTQQAGKAAGVIEVELPDGTIVEFPAGTDDATIKRVMQENFGPGSRSTTTAAGQTLEQKRALALAEARRRAAEARGPRTSYQGADPSSSNREEQGTLAQLRGNMVGNARAAADGLLFGGGDEYFAGLYAALGRDPQQGGWFNYDRPLGERYTDALGKVRAEEDAFKEAHPYTSAAAEMTGALIGPAKGGAGFIRNGANGLARMGRSGLVGAATAAGYGFGEGEGGTSNRAMQAAVSAPLGAIGGAAIGGLGEGFSAAIGALRSRRMPADTLPTIEGLKAEAGALYEAARQSGAVVPESTVKGMASSIGTKLKAEGFDKMLHPRVNAVLQRLSSEGGDKSLADLEILRRVAAGAANSIEPDERRLASMVLDGIDDAVEGMGGDAAPLKAAREVWSRMRRMETIETAVEKASLQDDFASGLRSQFKVLLRNPRRLRGFAEADIAAMRAIAKGEGGAGLLSGLGRRLSPSSITGLALTGGAGFGGAGFGAAAIPAAGMGMKRLGDALTTGSARKLSQRVGMDAGRRALVDALAGPVAPLVPLVVAPGLLAQALFQHPPEQ